MANFPDIALPDWEYFGLRLVKGQLKSNFEDGSVQSRPKHTSPKWIFTLGWKELSHTDLTLLSDFFVENIGNSFYYTHPLTSTAMEVRFANGELPEATSVGWNYWNLTGLVLEQV